ncbi:Hypothetical protein, putative [Bodo saltans]|uniref:RRM domain-containing protein n=1 Tax=Bodo saltans TaxID=75058 RepID=A0A0S4INV6_BODSA|nr:Hypothetical protein, putative [Bodo saltans]|eukprot:CUF73721.1 Hypothetical protein, putative [Bodo saltans]
MMTSACFVSISVNKRQKKEVFIRTNNTHQMTTIHFQPLSTDAAAVLETMTYRHSPYSFLSSKVIDKVHILGAMPYNESELEPAAPFAGDTMQIAAGCVPHGMKPARLRWVVDKLTGVTPLAVQECRKTSDGRRPTGVYFLTVRKEDAERVTSKNGCALCLPNWLWAPQDGLYDVASVSKELKGHEKTRVNALTLAVAKSEKKRKRQ